MNLRGSYRRLCGNAISAMLGAIEIYNKPRFAYRDEVFSILLINAWELLLKAIVSKSGKSIYYPKRRGEPYRTLSCRTAFKKAADSSLWPPKVERRAVEANIDVLSTYRDNAVHFYNDPAFSIIVYSLAQTSILNFRDVATHVFGKDISDEITWRIMPLGTRNPIDPIEYMSGKTSDGGRRHSKAIQDFLAFLKEQTTALDAEGIDSSRLLTIFDVTLKSVKKVDQADIVAGVTSEELTDSVIVQRRVDPNVSHPYRQKELLPKLKKGITPHTFQAIAFTYDLKDKPEYCWRDKTTGLVKWSPMTIKFVDDLTNAEVTDCLAKLAEARKRDRKSRNSSTNKA